jgi:8-oxo-dGTP pyrophosphatase MutT (NUDIX family)
LSEPNSQDSLDPLEILTASLESCDANLTKDGPNAAVAAILTRDPDPGILFIHRVAHEGDPWSGHIAFPGGRIEETDGSPRAAAERETMEEVGLDLGEGRLLGRLSDLTGSTMPVCVSCHVYSLPSIPDLSPNEEVEDAFSIRLSDLADRQRWVDAEFTIRGGMKPYPAIDLGLDGKPLLWGLTYRFVIQLLGHAGVADD